ncbi:MAG TPA: Asp23/Gls24 family envelope stress response protein [Anaerolineae bacterium]
MYDSPGRVTIAHGVLITIARLTTESVPGVARMIPSGVQGWLRRGSDQGVLLEVEGDHVRFDLFIVADAHAHLREVGQRVQEAVARAVRDLVGMSPEAINVHIQDVAYPELESKQENP